MPKDLNAQQTGIQKGNPVNDNTPRPIRGMNSFPDNFIHPDTHRFGDIDPFYIKNVLRHDRLPIRCGHEVRSYTLASPMLSDVVMHKTFVHVPMKAIYPLNWDLMLVPPTQGDDVPDDTRFVVKNLLSFCKMLKYYPNYNWFSSLTVAQSWELYLKVWFFFESIFSDGSLFAKMNMHFSPYFSFIPDEEGLTYSFDRYFDYCFTRDAESRLFDNMIFHVVYESGLNESIAYSLPDAPANWQFNGRILSLGAILEILRNNEFTVSALSGTTLSSPNVDAFSSFDFDIPVDEQGSNLGFNLEYIAAYQLACSQFMTNEHVDFIFSSELYRRELKSHLSRYFASDASSFHWPFFEYNGDRLEYDVFSGFVFDRVFSRDFSGYGSVDDVFYDLVILDVLRINVFTSRKSLKYGDYFTGSRPKPLAVGEVTVPLVDGSVDVLNTSRGISITRFRNTVNLVGRKVGNYLKGLWGGSLPQAPDDVPTFLASESFGIGKQEVENTGAEQASSDAQNIVTSNLRASNSKYLLTANFDQPAICIGLVYFDCPVIYAKTMSRFAFHYDRYDDFIPQLQYFGDQEIFARELGLRANGNFAYTIRNMEYKQSYSYASGGFVDFLKSWIMVQDNELGNPLPVTAKISPEYIRYTNYEFDRFFKSLTGLSLASRFHFIINHRNISTFDRQMAYTPQILQ